MNVMPFSSRLHGKQQKSKDFSCGTFYLGKESKRLKIGLVECLFASLKKRRTFLFTLWTFNLKVILWGAINFLLHGTFALIEYDIPFKNLTVNIRWYSRQISTNNIYNLIEYQVPIIFKIEYHLVVSTLTTNSCYG
jgi:hypothetical protein